MPGKVVDLLASWRGIKGISQIAAVWKMASICLLWCIWRERNDRNFEDQELSLEEYKSFFWKTLFMRAIVIYFNGLKFHDFLVFVSF